MRKAICSVRSILYSKNVTVKATGPLPSQGRIFLLPHHHDSRPVLARELCLEESSTVCILTLTLKFNTYNTPIRNVVLQKEQMRSAGCI